MRNLIVGVDGSESSLDALSWAARTVGTTGRLHAVCSLHPWTERIADAIAGEGIGYGEAIETALVRNWTSEIGFSVGELVTSASRRPVGDALDQAARNDHADAIVVGAHRGLRGLEAVKRIGSATNRLLRSTHHPVIVVPPQVVDDLDDGRVVVGIGHGDATRSAVRWAARLARTRSVSVELLHATDDAPVFQADGPVDFARHGIGDRAERERRRVGHFADLFQALAGPHVHFEVSAPPGLAALRLDEASERAALLVVGRHRSKLDRGHHTAQPLRHALTHSRCPVAVIADHDPDDLGDDGRLGREPLDP